MRLVLHILTKPDDSLASDIIEAQRALAGVRVEVVDLNTPLPDYRALLQKIFEADSVQVW